MTVERVQRVIFLVSAFWFFRDGHSQLSGGEQQLDRLCVFLFFQKAFVFLVSHKIIGSVFVTERINFLH